MIRDLNSERLVELHLPGGRVADIRFGVTIEYDGERYQGVGSEPSAVTWELIRRIRNGQKEKIEPAKANAGG